MPPITAARLKDQGNAYFGRRQFTHAIQAYTIALEHGRDQAAKRAQGRYMAGLAEEDNDVLLLAVIYSNRSACYFESGDYNRAAMDASCCLAELEQLLQQQQHSLAHDNNNDVPILSPAQEAKALSMQQANCWRRTRALLYQHDGCLVQAQARLDELSGKSNHEEEKKTSEGPKQQFPSLPF